jgi:predicted MFS family arabinose efflux permease
MRPPCAGWPRGEISSPGAFRLGWARDRRGRWRVGVGERSRAGLWANADFRKLWLGRTISELGSRITREGLPLTAVLVLAATPLQMGVLAALGAVPVLLVGLFAGVWVDRLRRRPLLIATDVGRAVLLLTIPLAAWRGWLHMGQLLVVAALTGILTVVFNVADQSFLPVLVSRAHLIEGNTKLEASGGVAEITGPPLAGVLVQTITAPMAILLDAVSFLVSAATVVAIRAPEPPPAPAEPQSHVGQEIRQGLRVVLGQPILRTLAITGSIGSFFGGFYAALYTLYAVRIVGVTPAVLGLLIAGGGVGCLAGAVLAGPAVRRYRLGPTMVAAAVVSAAAAFFTPLAGGRPLAVAVALMLAGQLINDGASQLFSIHAVSLRQTITPDPLLGRMNASMRVLEGGVHPFGILIGGALATVLGIQHTLFVAALGPVLGALWVVFSPIRHLHAAPSPIGAAL